MAESHAESRVATPAVVAQRMTDLLLCFPSAAIGGVQWHTLIKKYEEKHGEPLDLDVLGHSSALASATALLWDVIRIVEASDTDNPVVAVEDAIALTPALGALASWPSLYQVLCEIACKHGSLEQNDDADSSTGCHVILLSQVKPLLQTYWHSNFDEFGLTYFTEEGSAIKLKKMKHLLQAILRWRTLRLDWRSSLPGSDKRSSSRSKLDMVVAMQLTLVPSKKHNDLLLCCRCPDATLCPDPVIACTNVSPITPATTQSSAAAKPELRLKIQAQMEEASSVATASSESGEDVLSPGRLSSTSAGSSLLEQELALLRSENAKLRSHNHLLESKVHFNGATLRIDPVLSDAKLQLPPADMFGCLDDPFEPPPEIRHWASSPMSVCSTPGSMSFASGSLTPFSESSTSCAASGYATPVLASTGQMYNGVTMMPVGMPVGMPGGMPVWFQTIPTGVVQQARAMFEQHTAIPNWFSQRS